LPGRAFVCWQHTCMHSTNHAHGTQSDGQALSSMRAHNMPTQGGRSTKCCSSRFTAASTWSNFWTAHQGKTMRSTCDQQPSKAASTCGMHAIMNV
jgi:hypothetical protein